MAPRAGYSKEVIMDMLIDNLKDHIEDLEKTIDDLRAEVAMLRRTSEPPRVPPPIVNIHGFGWHVGPHGYKGA